MRITRSKYVGEGKKNKRNIFKLVDLRKVVRHLERNHIPPRADGTYQITPDGVLGKGGQRVAGPGLPSLGKVRFVNRRGRTVKTADLVFVSIPYQWAVGWQRYGRVLANRAWVTRTIVQQGPVHDVLDRRGRIKPHAYEPPHDDPAPGPCWYCVRPRADKVHTRGRR